MSWSRARATIVFPGSGTQRAGRGRPLLGARLVADGEVARAFHFAGGLHHAMRDRASGFCYVNDAVLAILYLRSRALRVAYIDIDAHHGDGVQHAFYDDPNVLTISTHERGDRLFPGTGFVEETRGRGGRLLGEPSARRVHGQLILHADFEAVVPPIVTKFRPDVIVASSHDSHRTDPLDYLAPTCRASAARVLARILTRCAPRAGPRRRRYDLGTVAAPGRFALALINDVDLPAELPPALPRDRRRGFARDRSGSSGRARRGTFPTPRVRRAPGRRVRRLIFPHHDL